jgi:hypothetical protein
VIAHIVLLHPKADLTPAERDAFASAFEHALSNIPEVKRATVGKRVRLGRLYDQQSPTDYSFAAILQFETEDDLRAYLDHPAHQQLGQQFYVVLDAALAMDFDMVDAREFRALLS